MLNARLSCLLFFVVLALIACNSPPASKSSNSVVIITNNETNNNSANNVMITECGPGRTLCGGECIDTFLDSQNCGQCSNICADGTVCSESQCAQVPTDCRVEGMCPARYFCDEGTGLCEVGCSTNADCPASSFCELESHACLCTEEGNVVCGNECVPESPLSCGSTCETCAPIANGAAFCTDGICGQACDSGYEMCDGTCAACPSGAGVVSVACLGGACVASECEAGHEICDGTCAACPATTGDETLGCDGAECIITDCTPGTRLCNGVCADCPSDPNGQTTCQGSTCVLLCSAGFHSCGGFCAADGDTDNCGPNCAFCEGDPNGTAVCGGGACALTCDADYRECQGACATCPTSPGVVATTCSGATCVVSSCAAGYQPCTGGCCQDAADGVAFDYTESIADISIALDSTGYPHIGMGSATANSVYYIWWDGSAWQNEFVRSGWAADIELDLTDTPHLGIWKRSVDELYYGRRDATTGWQTEVADTSFNDVGMTPDLELVGNDPHIAYYDLSQDNLRYARKSGSIWTDGPIYSTGEVGFSPAFVIVNGDFHVVYRDETNNWMRYSWGDGNNWNHDVISTEDSGNWSSLVANSNGDIHLAFVIDTFQNGDEVYYQMRPDGGDWTAPTFVGSGGHPSIVLGANNSPVVVYYKPNGTGIRYASASNGWTEAMLDNSPSVGEDNDAVYDPATGRVHVAYSDFSNRDVKYLSFTP